MALRNKDIYEMVNKCKFYEDNIERPEYISSWRYNLDKRTCRELEGLLLNHTPTTRRYKHIYNYRNQRPRIEYFQNNNTYIIVIFILFVMVVIFDI